jgi:hypothetical protein
MNNYGPGTVRMLGKNETCFEDANLRRMISYRDTWILHIFYTFLTFFFCREALANFLNKLETEHFVSQTAVGKICEEMLSLADKVHRSSLQSLRTQLEILDIPVQQRQTLLEEIASNPFQDLQQEFRSYYFVDKYLKRSPAFKFIEPTEIRLGSENKCTFQYISIIDTISNIIQDPSFSQENPSEDGMLRGVKDGSVYAENNFFQENKDALTIEIYSDAVELANPLGASRGKHKILNVYFSLAELPKGIRSKTENKFLVLSVKNMHVKTYRQEIYKPLLEDLKKLESGVTMNGKMVKAGLLCHLGDNLEAHIIAGMSQCFSSGYVCRMCHIKHGDLQNIR